MGGVLQLGSRIISQVQEPALPINPIEVEKGLSSAGMDTNAEASFFPPGIFLLRWLEVSDEKVGKDVRHAGLLFCCRFVAVYCLARGDILRNTKRHSEKDDRQQSLYCCGVILNHREILLNTQNMDYTITSNQVVGRSNRSGCANNNEGLQLNAVGSISLCRSRCRSKSLGYNLRLQLTGFPVINILQQGEQSSESRRYYR